MYNKQHIVDEYPLFDDFPRQRVRWGVFYPLFLARFKLGNIARRKALYIALNLHETWQTIQHLRSAAQRTPDLVDPHYGWSVSEIAQSLEETFPPDPNQLKGVNVRDVMDKLRRVVVPQIDKDLGLRALLTRVTP